MARESLWYGKTPADLQAMSMDEFAKLVPSGARRALRRGFTAAQKSLLKDIASGSPNIKTHCRDMVILPSFVGKSIGVHNGKEFVPVIIEKEMLGHRLGEFSVTCKLVQHSAPGIGATRSSAALSVR